MYVIILVLLAIIAINTLAIINLKKRLDTQSRMMDNVWSWITRHSNVKH